jgi:Holliday junction resolvase
LSNKKSGNDFENELCELLSNNGIWARKEFPAEDGSQPFDVKAFYNKCFYLFECKVLAGTTFDTRRIEENQISALNYVQEFAYIENVWFAFKLGTGEVRFTPASYILNTEKKIIEDAGMFSLQELIDTIKGD